MKKKILICFIFLIMLAIPNVEASSWYFEWSNTIVYIPVGEPLSLYKDKPQASLYKDNVLCNDAAITYSQEGDWLYYLKDVNTSVVGEYQVWYKAYENDKYKPGTCTGYKALIKFIVKDTEPPVINILEDTITVRRGMDYDYNANVDVTDNCSKDVKVNFYSDFDKNMVGSYSVSVSASDGYNTTTASFTIDVIDSSVPEITYLGEAEGINVGINKSVDLKKYFKATDSIDGDLTNSILFPVVDTSKLGSKEYNVTVRNKAGNEATKSFYINVIDDVEPVIKVLNPSVVLDYLTDLEELDLTKYISISDNTPINYKNLSITTNAVNAVGIYYVLYEYTDGNFTTTESIEIRLVSKIKPVIEVEPINLSVGDDINIEDYINVIDDSDPNIFDSIEIDDSNVDYSTPGTYYASIYAINSSGLSTIKKVKIVISSDASSNTISNTTSDIWNQYKIVIIGLLLIVAIIAGYLGFKYYRKKKNKAI